jgi:hypothetical protein
MDSPPDLDSFSEPDVAASVLKRHAAALQQACSTDLSQFAAVKSDALSAKSADWIPQFQAELNIEKEILSDGDLEHELLILFKTCNRREEFVDCYLRLAGSSPDHPVVRNWAGFALDYAQACAHTEEVFDALNHIVRFSRDPDLANKVRDQLEKWLSRNRSASPVNLPMGTPND